MSYHNMPGFMSADSRVGPVSIRFVAAGAVGRGCKDYSSNLMGVAVSSHVFGEA